MSAQLGIPGNMYHPEISQAAAPPTVAAVAAANGGVVPRGVLVNIESSLADTPMLHFKSDKAFLTAAELASRTAAASNLQASLQAQIAEKKARKDAEERAEKEREAAEMVHPRPLLPLVCSYLRVQSYWLQRMQLRQLQVFCVQN
jgi:hypothetical protein